MKRKLELSSALPKEIHHEIGQHSTNSCFLNLALLSKKHFQLFKPMLEVRKFLHHVVRGEHMAVKAMLKKDNSLIYKQGRVVDCSGRIFENISGFEYALWALDKHMWIMMLECIPKEKESNKILKKLQVQYEKLGTDKITYILNGEKISGKNFNFAHIIQELEIQVKSLHAPGEKDWEQMDRQWKENIGNAQKNLPMHVIYEYCSIELFDPQPQFVTKPASFQQFLNPETKKWENWFSINSKLGIDFAISKGRHPQATAGAKSTEARADWLAMKTLWRVRKNDFINLHSELEKRIVVDNQPPVFQI